MPLDFFCTGITLTHKSINCQPALFFKFTFRICKFKHSILFPRSISVSRSPQSQSKKAALPESWQLIEHEFETIGLNRAQTLPAFRERGFFRRTVRQHLKENTHIYILSQHPEMECLSEQSRQPYAGALSQDEIQSLEELDSERLSANWHLSSS